MGCAAARRGGPKISGVRRRRSADEAGGTGSAVLPNAGYDSLDHRSAVRAQLAGDAGFNAYFDEIRPWLQAQHAVLTAPAAFGAPAADAPASKFALATVPAGMSPPDASAGAMTLAACLALCDATPACEAVGARASGDGGLVDCYRKADVDLGACDAYYPFATWTKKA